MNLNLHEIEELALSEDTPIHQYAAQLVLRVRELEHELVDPNYLYGGTRISRQAIVWRNQEAERLRKQIKEQAARIEALKKALEDSHPKDLHDRS
jgi:predicted RNase H-like nuclease (RuvC/YqgF family)